MKLKTLANYNNPKSFGSKMRQKRMVPLKGLISRIYARKGAVNILDVGGRETYWNTFTKEFLENNKVVITIVNLPSDLSENNSNIFNHTVGDACHLDQYSDNEFDIVHSNSVIEHVGNWDRIKKFANEANRLAPNLFVQTPYFWFPIEPHFFKPFHHWLPKATRLSLWLRFKMGERERARSIDEAMQRIDDEPYLLDMRMFHHLFPDSTIIRERFLLFTKSLVAYRTE